MSGLPWAALGSLETLDLSNNRLRSLGDVVLMTWLRRLNLENNDVSPVPLELGLCTGGWNVGVCVCSGLDVGRDGGRICLWVAVCYLCVCLGLCGGARPCYFLRVFRFGCGRVPRELSLCTSEREGRRQPCFFFLCVS